MYDQLARIATAEFGAVITHTEMIGRRAGIALKLRLYVRDSTIIDVWLSTDQKRYAYHWEQRAKRGLIHRHDNAPDHPEIATHPKHFHNGAEENVEESQIPDSPRSALREFLRFVDRELTAAGE
jgi:hypothetical protein